MRHKIVLMGAVDGRQIVVVLAAVVQRVRSVHPLVDGNVQVVFRGVVIGASLVTYVRGLDTAVLHSRIDRRRQIWDSLELPLTLLGKGDDHRRAQARTGLR